MERSTHAIKNGVYHLFRLGPWLNHGYFSHNQRVIHATPRLSGQLEPGTQQTHRLTPVDATG